MNKGIWPIFFAVLIIGNIFYYFPIISFTILAMIIILAIIHHNESAKKLKENILIEYLEYWESMKGKDNVMSYEEYEKQFFVDLTEKRRIAALKKHQENLAMERSKKVLNPLESFLYGLKRGGLRTASTNRSGRRRKQ